MRAVTERILVLGAAYGGLHFTQELAEPPPAAATGDEPGG